MTKIPHTEIAIACLSDSTDCYRHQQQQREKFVSMLGDTGGGARGEVGDDKNNGERLERWKTAWSPQNPHAFPVAPRKKEKAKATPGSFDQRWPEVESACDAEARGRSSPMAYQNLRIRAALPQTTRSPERAVNRCTVSYIIPSETREKVLKLLWWPYHLSQ